MKKLEHPSLMEPLVMLVIALSLVAVTTIFFLLPTPTWVSWLAVVLTAFAFWYTGYTIAEYGHKRERHNLSWLNCEMNARLTRGGLPPIDLLGHLEVMPKHHHLALDRVLRGEWDLDGLHAAVKTTEQRKREIANVAAAL